MRCQNKKFFVVYFKKLQRILLGLQLKVVGLENNGSTGQ
jgi:hypothetical protein